MANEVKIKVTAEDATKPVMAGVEDGLHDVETASDKAGNSLRDVERELGIMDRKVTASRLELKRLAHEFANVDDEAQRIDISKTMAKIQRDISQATKAQKALRFSDLIPDTPDPASIGKLSAGLGKMAAVAGANVGPILGSSIGIAAAPVIGVTLAGAIIGGVGLGGVAGGFAVAAKDQRVKSAIKDLGDDLGDRLEDGVDTFIPAAVKGIGIVKKSLDQVNFDSIFDDAAKMVEPLAEGIGRAIVGLGDGITSLMKNAGPAVDAIAKGIGDIGESVGDGLMSLSDNGESAASALTGVFDGIVLVTDSTFALINGLAEANEWLNEFDTGTDSISNLANAIDGTQGTLGRYKAGADDAAAATTEFQEAAEELAKELKSQTDPVFGLVKAQEDLEKSQKAVNKAIEKFGKDSPEAKQALRDLATNALETQAAAGKLGDTFDGKLTPELRATLEAAGLTGGEINALEKQFKEAKREGDRFSGKYAANLAVNGDRNAKGRIRSITDDLRAFDGVWTATMVTNYVKHGKPGTGGGLAHGGIKGAAANGATSNGLTLVGEHGPELAEIAPGGRVWSNPDTQRMLNGAGGGQQEPIVIVLEVDGRRLADVVVEPLRGKVYREASGDAQKYWGRS